MDISRLFGVLVMGGSLLTTAPGCEQDDDGPGPDDPDPITSEDPDAAHASSADAAGVDSGGSDAGELIECGFCPNDECCEVDEHGNSSTKAGFECCWGTAC